MVGESTIQEHSRNCLALKLVARRKSGVPEDRITYHPHRHVRHFINKGWEEIGRKEEERRRNEEAEERRREAEKERKERQREEEETRREERAKGEKEQIKTNKDKLDTAWFRFIS